MTCIDAHTRARGNIRYFHVAVEMRIGVAEILVAQVARSPSSFPVLLPLSISLFLSFVASPLSTPTERRRVRVRCGVGKRK